MFGRHYRDFRARFWPVYVGDEVVALGQEVGGDLAIAFWAEVLGPSIFHPTITFGGGGEAK